MSRVPDIDDMMPCGECSVCYEYLDHRDLVFCEECKKAVHRQCTIGRLCRDCWDEENTPPPPPKP